MKSFFAFLFSFVVIAGLQAQTANEVCPIDGNPVLENTFLDVNARHVLFCSDECRLEYRAKLNVRESAPENCPITGRPASAEHSLLHVGTQLYNFCSDECIQQHITDSTFTTIDNGATTSPLTGEAAVADQFLWHNGEKLYFSTEAETREYLERIHVSLVGNELCIVDQKPVQPDKQMAVTATRTVYFCTANCNVPYKKKFFP